MPVALLLEAAIKELERGGKKLSPWEELVTIEDLLLRRARSAFLVHWFGSVLPLAGASLRVAIVNLADLRARYLAVRESRGDSGFGPNLLEPLAGMAGTLVGSLSSPVHSMVTFAILHRVVDRWHTAIVSSLVVITGGAFGIVLAALLGLASPLLVLGVNSPTLRGIYDVLGALARLARPLVRFWEIVTGPRSAVPNPIWREALVMLDRLARLAPFVLAFFAILVVRVGPLLQALARQLPLLADLARAVIDAVVFIVRDLLSRLAALAAPRSSPFALLKVAIAALRSLVPRLGRGFRRLLAPLLDALREGGRNVLWGLLSWWRSAVPQILQLTARAPLVLLIRSLIEATRVAIRIFRGMPERPRPSSSEPGFFDNLLSRLGREILAGVRAGGPIPSRPALPALPSVPAVTRAAGGPAPAWPSAADMLRTARERRERSGGLIGDPFALTREARRGLRRARRPPSLFAAERRALAAELAMPPERALALQRAEARRFRALLFAVAERVLPAPAAARVRSLGPILERLEETLGGGAPRRELPVLQVAEEEELRPVVRRLHLRLPGAEETAAREWLEGLARTLRAQPYASRATA